MAPTGLYLPCIFYPGIEHDCIPLCRCVETIIRYPVAEVTVIQGFCDVDGVDRGEETSDGSGSSGTNSFHQFMNLSTNPAFFDSWFFCTWCCNKAYWAAG